MASRVSSGSQFPVCLNAFSPASTSSHSTRRFPPDTFVSTASNTRCEARQMSGPVPSPSIYGITGRSGTTQRPSRKSMRSPIPRAPPAPRRAPPGRIRAEARRHEGCSLHGPGGVAPAERAHLDSTLMRRAAAFTVYALAAACWLAGGPGGATVDALIACRHHLAHQAHAGHAGAPTDGPCFCGEMTGGSVLAGLPALPAQLSLGALGGVALRTPPPPTPLPLPPSPPFPPQPPPPQSLGSPNLLAS